MVLGGRESMSADRDSSLHHEQHFIVAWQDRHREPQDKPDPAYPEGVDLDISKGATSCKVLLPYPAARCGFYVVRCTLCDFSVAITTAGRPDDPRSVTIPCAISRGASA
jgi:hypothetical protein